MTLTDRHCAPCEEGTRPLTAEEADRLGAQVPEWIRDGDRITRTFRFEDFAGAVDHVDRIAVLADAEGHHPDLHVSWGKVKVELWTHAIGGLSVNDYILAAKIDALQR